MSEIDVYARAEYAEALLVTRRWKNLIVLILLLILLVQIALFFTARYTDVLDRVAPRGPTPAMLSVPVSQPSKGGFTRDMLHYVLGGTSFLGVALAVVLSVALLLSTKVMLIARTLGVGRITSAYLWCILLIVLLFPWQAFLNNANLTNDRIAFKVPGVLYSWNELSDPAGGARFQSDGVMDPFGIVKWARFVAFPIVAIVILLMVQSKSSRAFKTALGESAPEAPLTA